MNLVPRIWDMLKISFMCRYTWYVVEKCQRNDFCILSEIPFLERLNRMIYKSYCLVKCSLISHTLSYIRKIITKLAVTLYGNLKCFSEFTCNKIHSCSDRKKKKSFIQQKDTYVKFGFRVTGTFSGPDIAYSSCHNTDYVFLDDSSRNSAMFV